MSGPRSQKKRRGTTMVEVALVLSLFLLFAFGICEYGRFVMTRQLLTNAAREGARYAVVHTYDGTTADVRNHVDQMLGGQGKQLQNYNKNTSIEVFKANPDTGANLGDWRNAAFGDEITVRISGTYRPVLPVFLLMPEAIQIKGECSMKSEAN